MDWLELKDVEEIVSLVSHAADPTVDLPVADRMRMLLENLAKLVEADFWLWASSVFNPDVPGDAAAVTLIDGGWTFGQQRAQFYEALYDPKRHEMRAKLQDDCRSDHV